MLNKVRFFTKDVDHVHKLCLQRVGKVYVADSKTKVNQRLDTKNNLKLRRIEDEKQV